MVAASSALIVQEPALTKVRVPVGVIVHTRGVLEVNVTVPAVVVAVSVGDVPKF